MEKEKIKALIINILTGVIGVGLLIVGYFVFTKKEVPLVGSVQTVSKIAEDTASIGDEINNTVNELQSLEESVKSSIIIFDLPEFRNLENFSVAIPSEVVGRANPFTPTPWKLKMKALESKGSKSVVPPTQGSANEPAQIAGGI